MFLIKMFKSLFAFIGLLFIATVLVYFFAPEYWANNMFPAVKLILGVK